MQPYETTLREWHICVEKLMARTSDCQEVLNKFVDTYVREDVIFSPPTYSKTYTGREWFKAILGEISKVIGSTFTYHRQWIRPYSWALEFATVLPNMKTMWGIDLISLDSDGYITELRVLAAPLNSIKFLKNEMAARAPRPKL